RSPRAAIGYLGEGSPPVADAEGFIDTGDIVERYGDRFYFFGRRSGIINVGGLKVYPEEVEAAINRHPAVRMSRVQSRKEPDHRLARGRRRRSEARCGRIPNARGLEARDSADVPRDSRRAQSPRKYPALEGGLEALWVSSGQAAAWA